MSKNHVPNGKTQAKLFALRSISRTESVQRQSETNRATDEGGQALKRAEEHRDRELHRQSVKRLNNAEQTILSLLRNSEAFQQTIDRLTDAWGEDKDKALGFAQEVLDQTSKDLEKDPGYTSRAHAWTRDQMGADSARPVARPRVKKP